MANKTETAIFAGGCFWCTEAALDSIDGVIETLSGYTGGQVENPTYNQVSTGKTGHYEGLKVTYDPSKVTYHKVLNAFWLSIDPLDGDGQFADRGSQYKTAIFYANDEQKKIAEASKANIEKMIGEKIVTEILPAEKFWPAEEYHQDYYKNNSLRYNAYKLGSGREKKLHKFWEVVAKELFKEQ